MGFFKKKLDLDKTEVDYDIDYASLEAKANRFTVVCLIITYFIMGVMWILNLLGIFIVQKSLMNYGFFLLSVVMLILVAVCNLVGYDKPWLKYVILTFAVLMTTVLSIALTYHMIIASVLPLIYAIQYSDKKLLFYTYALSVIGIFASVMGGYYLGLCDANMVLLTTSTLDEYVDEAGIAHFGPVNDNPWVTLPLFYAFPRSIILLALIPVLLHVSNGMAKRELKGLYLQRMSEIDDMTQLYNKNKYLSMIKEHYPAIKEVGVIFWDVNGLKETNDTLGHVMGDKLIAAIADSIRGFTNDKCRAYRVGGDEFIMICEDENELKMNEIVNEWNKIIAENNKESEIPLSAAVGYAAGKGENIGAIIKRADDRMYANKIAGKKNRK
ncbi:MAG: diguanylate cyclase [Lachnospiraceae bacterium]|nr:diguanylate cyclase [Lachnospiraceae bacterium]